MRQNYNLKLRLLAHVLLISLFLQNCSNSPIPSTSLKVKYEHKQDFTKGQSLEIGSHEHREDPNAPFHIPKDHALTLAENQLPIAQVEEVIPSIDAQQFSTANHTIYRSSRLANKIIPQEKGMQLVPRKISSNLTNPQIDEKLSCLFKMDSGKRVKIYQQEKKWQAKVKEKIGVFRGESYLLPVYFELGMGVEQLASLPPSIQERYLHLILPKASIGQLGYMYIGKKGLRGGMKRKKDKEKMTQEEEEEQEKSNPETQFERGKQAYKRWKEHRKEADSQEVIKWLNRAAGQGHQKAEDLLSKFEREIIKARENQQSVNRQEVGGSSKMELSDSEEETYSRKRKYLIDIDQNNQSDDKIKRNLKLTTNSKKRKTVIEEKSKQQELDGKMVKVGLTDIPEEHLNLEYCVKEKAYLDLLKKDILPYLKKKNKKTPTCFISYAEGDGYHEQWVERFAKVLNKAGIQILLNRWVNKKGDLSNEFSKKMEAADWIIVVGTKLYLKKYNKQAESPQEKEHVITLEGQLIDYLIGHSTETGSKVIPILLEGTSEESLPFTLLPKIAVEFTKGDYFEEILKLIRDLYKIDNRNKSFEGFIEKFRKYASAAATTITPEERKRYKAKRTAKIEESDQKILEHTKAIKEKALKKSESSSDESSSDEGEGRQSRLRMTTFKDSTVPTVCPLHSYLPIVSLNDDYIPRASEQEKLHRALKKKGICVISGHGGAGKSTLVAEYGRKQQNKQVIWWIPAETAEKLITSYNKLAEESKIDYQRLAKEFKQDSSQYLAELGRKIYNALEDHYQPTLLILDNATDSTLIDQCLLHKPKLVQAIITTRNKRSFENYSQVELGPFTEKEGESYIQQRLQVRKPSEKDISAIIEEIHLIPHKLALVTSYLKTKRLVTIQDYLNKLRELKKDGKKEDETFVLPEAKLGLETLGTQAQLLMRYGAYLDPDFIPLSLIAALLEVNNKEVLESLLNELEELSLVTFINEQSDKIGIRIHREIQTACKEYQNWQGEAKIAEQDLLLSLLKILDNHMPNIAEVPDSTWDQARIYAPSVISVLANAGECLGSQSLLANIFHRMGNYSMHMECNYQQALKYHEQAYNMRKKLYSGPHTDIANSLNNLGIIYERLGQYQKALEYHQQALDMLQALHTGNHPHIAASTNNLGLLYQELGQYEIALKYLKPALELSQSLHSGNHPDVTTSLNNLGLVYQGLGQYKDALKYYQQALKMSRALYPGNHPYTAGIYNNLGALYGRLGKYQKALRHLKQARGMYQALDINNHADIARLLNNLGDIYYALGQYETALEYLEQAFKMWQKLGVDKHMDIVIILHSLGNVYDKLNKGEEALKYHQQASAMKQALYSGYYSVIARSLNNLGNIYSELEQHQEALRTHRQAHKIWQALYAGNHPYIAKSLNNLGTVYSDLGQHEKALKYHQQALDMKQALHPGNHSDIAHSLNNLGIVHQDLAQRQEALKHHHKALKMRNALYTGNHPDIAESLNNLGTVYKGLEKYKKALKFHRQALEMYQALYIYNHPYIAGSLNNLGMVYEDLGQHQKALKYYEQALKMYQALGSGKDSKIELVIKNITRLKEKSKTW